MTPALLDLCCGAGLASDGYMQAGFGVTGVDLYPQPEYPYGFTQGDALHLLEQQHHQSWRANFDAIHVSPPCQLR